MEGVDERADLCQRGMSLIGREFSTLSFDTTKLIDKAAKIVLATPASEAICERLFKQTKHIGTTDRMARLLDETFEMLVMAQYNIAQHGGVEAMEVSIFSMTIVLID